MVAGMGVMAEPLADGLRGEVEQADILALVVWVVMVPLQLLVQQVLGAVAVAVGEKEATLMAVLAVALGYLVKELVVREARLADQ